MIGIKGQSENYPFEEAIYSAFNRSFEAVSELGKNLVYGKNCRFVIAASQQKSWYRTAVGTRMNDGNLRMCAEDFPALDPSREGKSKSGLGSSIDMKFVIGFMNW